MDEYKIIYRNPVMVFPEMHEIHYQVENWLKTGEIISGGVAQSIAAWWHSPRSPQSTILSTMGCVTDDMRIDDFADSAEYLSAETDFDRKCLDALEAYIFDKQNGAPF